MDQPTAAAAGHLADRRHQSLVLPVEQLRRRILDVREVDDRYVLPASQPRDVLRRRDREVLTLLGQENPSDRRAPADGDDTVATLEQLVGQGASHIAAGP